ncbi:hypothetical protein [Limnobaculum parvum]|uniref:Uncharacterized protein n=1 Tax=Limnobaculum parvum TaxID=2172103 RepID=A0A2Y9TUJ8_9GAMM|nr:hypothetical protein [Limnobaculum parvum]AWH87333.1 hypothetical protein HYN51_01400 [Limnobaculum parvum]
MIREMINTSDDKSLTQGTIFNCAFCPRYKNDEIFGLIITARCDIANENKVRTYNFIPVIPFNLWKEFELSILLKDRVIKSITNQLKQLIEKSGFTMSNLNTYGEEKILEIIKKDNKLKTTDLSNLLIQLEKLHIINEVGNYEKKYSIFKRDIEEIIKSVIENKVSDYFFIDEIAGYGASIANLREIYEIDIETAKMIKDGLTLKRGRPYLGLNNKLENDFCSIIGQLKSPYIELLLQRFANNFTRIGIDNHNSLIINKICEVS